MEDLIKNKKYNSILDAARELFWKHGIRRVSVEEICQKAETSKMTFYRFFPNKIELAKSVLERYYAEGLISFRKLLREDSPVAEKMQKIIRMKLDGSSDLSNEFIQDLLSSTTPELSSYFKEKMKLLYSEVINEFKIGQTDGWVRKDLNVEFMFYYFQKSASLLADKDLLSQFRSPQEMILEVSNLMIYGIVPRE